MHELFFNVWNANGVEYTAVTIETDSLDRNLDTFLNLNLKLNKNTFFIPCPHIYIYI